MTPEQRLQQSLIKLRDSLHEMELAFIDLATELQTLSSHLIAWEASYLAAYRAAGSPYGDSVPGMRRWVRERFPPQASPAAGGRHQGEAKPPP